MQKDGSHSADETFQQLMYVVKSIPSFSVHGSVVQSVNGVHHIFLAAVQRAQSLVLAPNTLSLFDGEGEIETHPMALQTVGEVVRSNVDKLVRQSHGSSVEIGFAVSGFVPQQGR